MKFSDVSKISSSNQYLRLNEGDNRVRIVSEPIMLWKAFNKIEKTATVYLTEKTAKMNPDAKLRFMMWAINRDTAEIQQLETGISVIRQIEELQKNADYKFDELPPYDITIRKSGTGLETEYTVLPARVNTEITAAERVQIDALEPLIDILKRDAVDADSYEG